MSASSWLDNYLSIFTSFLQEFSNFPLLYAQSLAIMIPTILISFFWIHILMRVSIRARIRTCIVRIMLMVPIYSITAFQGLRFPYAAVYIRQFRECYEAIALYSFFFLLILVLGNGSEMLIVKKLLKKPKTDLLFPMCCFGEIQPGPSFLYWTKQGVLQFVLVKPLLSIACVMLEMHDLYNEGVWDLRSGYPYIAFIASNSQMISIYALTVMYLVVAVDLRDIRPIPKFQCIKIIVFLMYWQGIQLSMIHNYIPDNVIFSKDVIASQLNEVFILVEMLPCSQFQIYSFKPIDFAKRKRKETVQPSLELTNLNNNLDNDVIDDLVSPTLHSELLYDLPGSPTSPMSPNSVQKEQEKTMKYTKQYQILKRNPNYVRIGQEEEDDVLEDNVNPHKFNDDYQLTQEHMPVQEPKQLALHEAVKKIPVKIHRPKPPRLQRTLQENIPMINADVPIDVRLWLDESLPMNHSTIEPAPVTSNTSSIVHNNNVEESKMGDVILDIPIQSSTSSFQYDFALTDVETMLCEGNIPINASTVDQAILDGELERTRDSELSCVDSEDQSQDQRRLTLLYYLDAVNIVDIAKDTKKMFGGPSKQKKLTTNNASIPDRHTDQTSLNDE